jgi:hypothetical protein
VLKVACNCVYSPFTYSIVTLGSRYSSNPNTPPSLPIPDCQNHLKGAWVDVNLLKMNCKILFLHIGFRRRGCRYKSLLFEATNSRFNRNEAILCILDRLYNFCELITRASEYFHLRTSEFLSIIRYHCVSYCIIRYH